MEEVPVRLSKGGDKSIKTFDTKSVEAENFECNKIGGVLGIKKVSVGPSTGGDDYNKQVVLETKREEN